MTEEELSKKHYLSELPREEIEKLILYPSDIYNDIYEIVAEDNGNDANELMEEILGKGYEEWTRVDPRSHDWWMHIKPGRYGEVLHIKQYDYFSEGDTERIKELQAKVKELSDKVGELSVDDPEYYDKLNKWKDKADDLADDILKIVDNLVKNAEEVTDEQIVDAFIREDYGDFYWFYGGNKGIVYRTYTKPYKTNYKGEQ